MNDSSDPKGRILRVTHHPDGTSRVVLDNGVVNTITLVTYSDDLPALLGQDMQAIREHLMTRKAGHFRTRDAK